ncbi:hypothetical protein E4T56_gene6161 [Termitomyces sp. T112]|nr:hypothetical protein E4T56_gene6161 [Termitomyces sp. T112]
MHAPKRPHWPANPPSASLPPTPPAANHPPAPFSAPLPPPWAAPPAVLDAPASPIPLVLAPVPPWTPHSMPTPANSNAFLNNSDSPLANSNVFPAAASASPRSPEPLGPLPRCA